MHLYADYIASECNTVQVPMGEHIFGLKLQNIGFKDAAPTYLEDHAVPSGPFNVHQNV